MGWDYAEYRHYPEKEERDQWIKSIWELAESAPVTAEVIEDNGFRPQLGLFHQAHFRYVRFDVPGFESFYAYWQPALSGPAPLLVHVPGYGSEMVSHPELAYQGYNILHISPMGYTTPQGSVDSKKIDNEFQVLPESITSAAQAGYRIWLANCIQAVSWATGLDCVLKKRISFFGTSQGGGTALLLCSVFKGKGVRCVAADVPYLTDFPQAVHSNSYEIVLQTLEKMTSQQAGWRAIGFIDTVNHADRLTVPVLLTSGGADDVCPPGTIQHLFEKLPGTKSLTHLEGMAHGFTPQFLHLVSAWFRLYA